MVKVGKCALMHKKWTLRVELTKKTSSKTPTNKNMGLVRDSKRNSLEHVLECILLPSNITL